MGAEKIIETKVRKFLKLKGFRTYKIHVGQYGPKGFPDLVVIKSGITSYLEVKDIGEVPTPIQWLRIGELRNSGCVAGPVWSIRDICELLNIEE